MKIRTMLTVSILALAAGSGSFAKQLAPAITGDYLEVRTCDIYAGYCVANSEMGTTGREGMMVWSVREGSWQGTSLNGLSVIAVVHTDQTLGDLHYQPRSGKAVLIVDAKANAKQRQALADFARSMAGQLIGEVADVKTSDMNVAFRSCSKEGCATVKAGNLVEISTRCLNGKDHLCGNEETYYPPLTQVEAAMPAYTEMAAFHGSGLNLTWESTAKRSAFLATFSR